MQRGSRRIRADRRTAANWSSTLGRLNKPASSVGITQLGARAYDAGVGRFLAVDPLLDTGDPRHANACAYSFNSPVLFSDAGGLIPFDMTPKQWIAVAGAAGGVVTYSMMTDAEDRTPEGFAITAVGSAALGAASAGVGLAAGKAIAALLRSKGRHFRRKHR